MGHGSTATRLFAWDASRRPELPVGTCCRSSSALGCDRGLRLLGCCSPGLARAMRGSPHRRSHPSARTGRAAWTADCRSGDGTRTNAPERTPSSGGLPATGGDDPRGPARSGRTGVRLRVGSTPAGPVDHRRPHRRWGSVAPARKPAATRRSENEVELDRRPPPPRSEPLLHLRDSRGIGAVGSAHRRGPLDIGLDAGAQPRPVEITRVRSKGGFRAAVHGFANAGRAHGVGRWQPIAGGPWRNDRSPARTRCTARHRSWWVAGRRRPRAAKASSMRPR